MRKLVVMCLFLGTGAFAQSDAVPMKLDLQTILALDPGNPLIDEITGRPVTGLLIADEQVIDGVAHMEGIPLNMPNRDKIPIQLTFEGQPWYGKTTVYAGMEIANVFSLFQHPGKYTIGEWGTWAAVAGGTYLLGEEQEWWGSGSSSSGGGASKNDSNLGDVSGPGGNTTTFGNIINSTVQVVQGSNDPTGGEGANAFDQGSSNSDGTVSGTP